MKSLNLKLEDMDILKNDLQELLKRIPTHAEEINIETDALMLARLCIKKIAILEEEIKKLKP